jgi:hypothetical protein
METNPELAFIPILRKSLHAQRRGIVLCRSLEVLELL